MYSSYTAVMYDQKLEMHQKNFSPNHEGCLFVLPDSSGIKWDGSTYKGFITRNAGNIMYNLTDIIILYMSISL